MQQSKKLCRDYDTYEADFVRLCELLPFGFFWDATGLNNEDYPALILGLKTTGTAVSMGRGCWRSEWPSSTEGDGCHTRRGC